MVPAEEFQIVGSSLVLGLFVVQDSQGCSVGCFRLFRKQMFRSQLRWLCSKLFVVWMRLAFARENRMLCLLASCLRSVAAPVWNTLPFGILLLVEPVPSRVMLRLMFCKGMRSLRVGYGDS